jgi:large subunit ribosomal protein L3
MKAIIGKKLGMTQVFAADGTVVPVTVILAGPCAVVQKKTVENDGYDALQVGYEDIRENLVSKPKMGQYKKASVSPKRFLREIKLDCSKYEVGQEIKCDIFKEGDIVDVTGLTHGHGFSGVIKRWNQHRLKETHGVGPVHREVGSMSSNSDPSRVFKGKNLPGRYGHERVTVLNLSVAKVDAVRNVIMIRGAVPGVKGALVTVRSAVKTQK